MKKTLIAVYGTLRRGEGANYMFDKEGVEYAGEAHIRGKLLNIGSFPGFVNRGKGIVVCDLYSVPTDSDTHTMLLNQLDRYEGYSPDNEPLSLYVRREIPVEGYDTKACLYVWNGDEQIYPVIESGDWKNR